MPKVELVGGMNYIDGWDEVARTVQQKMEDWPELKDWTVKIRVFTKEDAKKSEQGDEDASVNVNEENKILTVAFKAEPDPRADIEADLIMDNFVDLEVEGKI